MPKYLIIGAGPCGIGAARRLHELGVEDFLVLERHSQAGGLATSFLDENGFTWDIGGHVQFSHYEYFDRAMIDALGEDGWFHHQRESWVWINSTLVPYPFQNNVHLLGKETFKKCLDGLERAKKSERKDFSSWLEGQFGEEICNIFMRPYNLKVWRHPLEEMSHVWISERVAPVNIDRLKKTAANGELDISWGPNSTFQFPKKGGTGAIWKSLASKISSSHIKLGAEVSRIDLNQKRVFLSSGDAISYEYLISTIPIDILVKRSGATELAKELPRLVSNTTNVIGLGIEGRPNERLKGKNWLYFPEDEFLFYRMTLFSHYSRFNVPDADTQYSLMLEVNESESFPNNRTRKEMIDHCEKSLRSSGWIDKKHKIVSRWHHKVSHGYPIPSIERDLALDSIIPWLESKNVYSRGRFGLWKYEISNQDHTFMQGVEIINRLENGEKELTYQR